MSFEPGSFTPGKEINADYQIIDKVRVGSVEYAPGEHDGEFPFLSLWRVLPPTRRTAHLIITGEIVSRTGMRLSGTSIVVPASGIIFARNRKPSIKAQPTAKLGPSDKPTAKSKDREVR